MPAKRQTPAKLLKAGTLGGPAEGQAATRASFLFGVQFFAAVLMHASEFCHCAHSPGCYSSESIHTLRHTLQL